MRKSFTTKSSFNQPSYTMSNNKKVITVDSINPNVKAMEYAVRGSLVIRAVELETELANGVIKPFKNVIKANIGDAQAMGQIPITFIRQVLAVVIDPTLLNNPNYPSDVKQRAQDILDNCGGNSIGSYTQSTGIGIVRKHVAEYIARRDGHPSDSQNIALSSGASEAIRSVLKLFINCQSPKKTGIMIPVPQYPLYSAAIEEFNLGQVNYYLDEDNEWSLDLSELKRSYEENKDKYNIKAIVIVNPGNPTGQVLTRENIEVIITFAHEYNLFILADEVYQDNVYAEGSTFHSFKKVLVEMDAPYNTNELASFHSVSKGYMGECGMRGGYVEFLNIDPTVFALFKKMISAKLCSSAVGQTVVDCVAKPPIPGEPSYNLWLEEKTAILKSLKTRATLVKDAYSAIEGITLNPVQGAMYAFPRLHLPPKAIEAAKAANQAPDFFYAWKLLEATGVCIVPGSGFGQRDGTYHFRTTMLPQSELFIDMLTRFKGFHENFLKEYA